MGGKIGPRPDANRTLASARLRKARCAAGLTQEQLARMLGTDARQVRRWENAEVSLGALEALELLERKGRAA